MNYEGIANFVHECVKNPKNLMTKDEKYGKNAVKPSELSVIQNVFSRCEVSGGTVAIEVGILETW
ncbi:hypothetical protein [Dehalobacter sp. TBBPA1]|uniref:hypothetical protein n=1 Tax=Dehalobacter sp. TBBPA1 TaxID=3235037 RepID=UPI0034A10B62